MDDRVFDKLSRVIYYACGIKMPRIKKTMLAARLRKRLRILGLDSFPAYLDYITSPAGQADEFGHMIDVVSTNKTDFFRETKHFDLMTRTVLPEIIQRRRPGNHHLRVWSAGCSTGEEPYTLAMVLDDFLGLYPEWNYSILATDICTEVLSKARTAIYSEECIAPVPTLLRQKYLMKGKGRRRGTYRVVPELRRRIDFRRLNFMENDFAIRERMDIIMCRNVVIYFDRQTQGTLYEKFYRQLATKGYLFTGHSETLHTITDRMQRIESALYQCLKK